MKKEETLSEKMIENIKEQINYTREWIKEHTYKSGTGLMWKFNELVPHQELFDDLYRRINRIEELIEELIDKKLELPIIGCGKNFNIKVPFGEYVFKCGEKTTNNWVLLCDKCKRELFSGSK